MEESFVEMITLVYNMTYSMTVAVVGLCFEWVRNALDDFWSGLVLGTCGLCIGQRKIHLLIQNINQEVFLAPLTDCVFKPTSTSKYYHHTNLFLLLRESVVWGGWSCDAALPPLKVG